MKEESEVHPSQLGERFAPLRLPEPSVRPRLVESLRRYGQTAPLIAWRAPDESLELLDGFKRLEAMRELGWSSVRVAVITVNRSAARVAVVSLNQTARPLCDLEEGFVVRALVREDGLAQTEVAQLLGRDKSWVCRRLSLVERLSDELQAQLRLGLLDATRARELARLPRGNQEEVQRVVRAEGLGSRQTARLVERFVTATREQQVWMLAHPLEAIENAGQEPVKRPDIRLGDAANRLLFQLERIVTSGRTLVQGLLQVPLSTLTPTEQRLLQQRLRLARIEAGQVNVGLERALNEQEKVNESTESEPQAA